MSEKSQAEALRLAEIVEQFGGATAYQAAAELRRLHARNMELESVVHQMLAVVTATDAAAAEHEAVRLLGIGGAA